MGRRQTQPIRFEQDGLIITVELDNDGYYYGRWSDPATGAKGASSKRCSSIDEARAAAIANASSLRWQTKGGD